MKPVKGTVPFLLGATIALSLLSACSGEKRSEKIEITPYILNLHLKYSFIDNFKDGLARVMMKTKTESGRETGVFGCIDEEGHEVIPCIYEIYRARWSACCSEKGRQQAFCPA